MEKIERPSLKEIPSLNPYIETFAYFNIECEKGSKSWQSSGIVYNLIKDELNSLTKGHCSFCDGYPLNETSRETIEHYFPKAKFKVKTYEWENLFLACDKCQSFANSDKPFKKTLKMDELDYNFEHYFWFDAENGEIKVLENLEPTKNKNAIDFLKRYGINKSKERLFSRRQKYYDLIIILKSESRERDFEPFRFVYDSANKTIRLLSN